MIREALPTGQFEEETKELLDEYNELYDWEYNDMVDFIKEHGEKDFREYYETYNRICEDYGKELRYAYDVAKNLDYDNTEQLKNFVEGITHFENSANSEDYRNYYTEKDYDDAVKLFQEKKLFEQIDNSETKGEGFEMRKLGL